MMRSAALVLGKIERVAIVGNGVDRGLDVHLGRPVAAWHLVFLSPF
jgi:hypothetical protein